MGSFLKMPDILSLDLASSNQSQRAFLLVFCCTLLAAGAQILVKRGAQELGVHVTLQQTVRNPALFVSFAISILGNGQLFAGYVLSGLNAALLTLALKGQELSRIYPIIALTFVWVTGLSLFLFPGEHMNAYRAAGIILIVAGVSVLGLKK